LQEQLSARYAREAKYEEEIEKYKNVVINLSESAKNSKTLKTKVDSLNEQLTRKTTLYNDSKSINSKLTEELDSMKANYKTLKENYNKKLSRISELEKALNEQVSRSTQTESRLKESLEEAKQNSVIKSKEYLSKINKANSLIEHYKQIVRSTVSKYIDGKARMIGVSPAEITNKLPENYSFKDIDRICEELQTYTLNIKKLPFQIDRPVKMKITESKNDPLKIPNGLDDDISEDLVRLAKGVAEN